MFRVIKVWEYVWVSPMTYNAQVYMFWSLICYKWLKNKFLGLCASLQRREWEYAKLLELIFISGVNGCSGYIICLSIQMHIKGLRCLGNDSQTRITLSM